MERPKVKRKGGDDLPHSDQAEQSVLSAIIIDPGVLLDVVELLTPEDFYSPSNRAIYGAVLDLFRRGESVDLVTLVARMEDLGDVDRLSGGGYTGVTYLSWVAETAPDIANAAHYARIVRDRASLRRLAKACHDTLRDVSEGGVADDIVEAAERRVFAVADASQAPRDGFVAISRLMDEALDDIERRQQAGGGDITGVPTGFSAIDSLTGGLQRGEMIVLAARPSMGKTALALNIAVAAAEAGHPVGIFSLEMSRQLLALRIVSTEAEVSAQRLRSGSELYREDMAAVMAAAARVSRLPIRIDDRSDLTPLQMRAAARRMRLDAGLGLVIVDYIQLMSVPGETERRELEVAEISRSMKAMAKELNVPVVALSQLNRKLEERVDKRPRLSDLRESGSIEQDADVVAFIYRDEVYNRAENNPNKGFAEVLVEKHRNGPTGKAVLGWDHRYTRFVDLDREGHRHAA